MASLTVNGAARNFDGDPAMPLLWYLRDELQMTGTKFGCGMALCGACTVHLDGAAVRSCSTPMSAACRQEGHDHRRASMPKGQHPLQVAWREQGVPQCGYCQSGQIMQAAALLATNKKPTDAGHRGSDVRQHLPLRHLHRASRPPSSRPPA